MRKILLLVLCLSGLILSSCVSSPPPMPLDAGQIKGTTGSVRWVSGISSGNSVPVGPCNRVLAIDGGGIRGLIPALLLKDIENRTGKPISSLFDLIVGTSTGAILALGLTRPDGNNLEKPAFSAADMVEIYVNEGKDIFPYHFDVFRELRRFYGPKYDPHGIETVLKGKFGDVKFADALTQVLIPGYDIEDEERLWFDSFSEDAQYIFMRDIARGATAAPTYLPPARFTVTTSFSPKGYVAIIDGGVFANNPAQVAFARGKYLGRDVSDLLLLSIGTGKVKEKDDSKKPKFEEMWNWGEFRWLDKVLNIMTSDPSIGKEVERLMDLAGPRNEYHRFQVDLTPPTPVNLDDASPDAIKALTEATKEYLNKNEAEKETELKNIAYRLNLPKSPECGMRSGSDHK